MNIVLDNSNNQNLVRLNNDLQKKKDFLLWFYADWCGHCKAMEEEWKTLGSKCNGKYNVAKVRDDVAPNLVNRLGENIMGYPKIVLISNGKEKKEYQGPRESVPLLKFLKENAQMSGSNSRVKKKCSRKKINPMRLVKVPCGNNKVRRRRRSKMKRRRTTR